MANNNQFNFDSLDEFSSQESNSSYASSIDTYSQNVSNDQNNTVYFSSNTNVNDFEYFKPEISNSSTISSASSSSSSYASMASFGSISYNNSAQITAGSNVNNYASVVAPLAPAAPLASLAHLDSLLYNNSAQIPINNFNGQFYNMDYNNNYPNFYGSQNMQFIPFNINVNENESGNISKVQASAPAPARLDAPQASASMLPPNDHDLKLLQKRERNRIAARKCREKKLNQIKLYENRIQELQVEIRGHEKEIGELQARRSELRQMLINHLVRHMNQQQQQQEF